LEALPEFARASGLAAGRNIPSVAAIEAELAKAAAQGMRLVAVGEPDYPPLLAKIDVPPPLLYMRGDPSLWRYPTMGIVGSRHASAAGLKFAAEMSTGLCREGFRVVSGLARGIDAAAHWAALSHGTVAVLPGGLDEIYPPQHAKLAEAITETGVLISESAPGFQARAQDFPRRNRLISGSCLGILVIEAAARSGSLITARLAAEQNREVFAVPGHPLDPRAAGTNGLLKQGATLATCPEDIVETLRPLLGDWSPPVTGSAEGERRQPSIAARPLPPSETATDAARMDGVLYAAARDLLRALSLSPIDIDELVRVTGMETRLVSAALLTLDLEGKIERHGHRLVALRPS
jgi:DNA processing protein